MAAGKCQEVAVLRHAVSHCLHLQDCLGEFGESCFLSKKLPKGVKDLKTVRSKAQNQRNRPLQLKNMSLPPLPGIN
jgi:hypothetical protein